MRKRMAIFLFACLTGLCACKTTATEVETEPATTIEITTELMTEEKTSIEETLEEETEPATYTFVNVKGEVFEAPLLDGVPKTSYDYTRIETDGEFKYYLDEKGHRISRLGIDVSKYQPNVDWESVKAMGIDFAIVRCGFRGYGASGKLVEDEAFQKHVSGAKAAGLQVGVYFFSQAITKEEAVDEANFVLGLIADQGIDGPVIFDTEEIKDDTARTDHLTPEQFTDHCIAFCERIKEAGYSPMIYANMPWLAFTLELERLNDYEIWYADYEPVPQSPYRIAMWQYTETGRVPGIEGNVDLNVWFSPS